MFDTYKQWPASFDTGCSRGVCHSSLAQGDCRWGMGMDGMVLLRFFQMPVAIISRQYACDLRTMSQTPFKIQAHVTWLVAQGAYPSTRRHPDGTLLCPHCAGVCPRAFLFERLGLLNFKANSVDVQTPSHAHTNH